MKYDNLLFENIKELWCHIDKINEFVSLYLKDKNTIKDTIDYITYQDASMNRGDTSYKKINKDKLLRWFSDNNMNVIDVTHKKLEAKSREQIIKEYCYCKSALYNLLSNNNSYMNKNNGVLCIINEPKYINCTNCGDQIKNPKYKEYTLCGW